MANTTLSAVRANSVANLGTNTFNVVTDGVYKIGCRSHMNAPTALIITINLNGSQILQSGTPAVTSSGISLETTIGAVTGDAFTVVLTSSDVNDALPNNVQSSIYVGRI